MKSTAAVVAPALLLSALVMAQSASAADGPRFNVIPFEFDPQGSRLVASEWKGGLGCPTGATIRPFVESPSAPGTFVLGPPTPYTDPACPTGDQRDKRNQGLLLAKTGPTNNNASAGATITGVKGISLSELGYDLRKPVAFADPRGSHCGAGAPRFNVVTKDGVTHFVGCASPPPAETQVGNGWIRLRWLPAEAFPPILPGDEVKSLSILFDEGQDTGPDNFGLAVLDNIDVNGVLIGQGPNRPGDNDRDEGRGEDKDRRNFEFHDSASRPESSGLSFEDRAEEVSVPERQRRPRDHLHCRLCQFCRRCTVQRRIWLHRQLRIVRPVRFASTAPGRGAADRQLHDCGHRAGRRRLSEVG